MMLERKDGSKYDTRDRNTGKMSNHSGFCGLVYECNTASMTVSFPAVHINK